MHNPPYPASYGTPSSPSYSSPSSTSYSSPSSTSYSSPSSTSFNPTHDQSYSSHQTESHEHMSEAELPTYFDHIFDCKCREIFFSQGYKQVINIFIVCTMVTANLKTFLQPILH